MPAYTAEERTLLSPFVTNLDRPVFALRNVPAEIIANLFSRYSRSHKSLRRVLLDDYITPGYLRVFGDQTSTTEETQAFFDRVLVQYGDDSVIQLGDVHIACEGISNLATKWMQRSRLSAALEQSTRYIRFDRTDENGDWMAVTPDELKGMAEYEEAIDTLFSTYSELYPIMLEHFDSVTPKDGMDPAVRKRTVRSKALDSIRGLLPVATKANMGIKLSGQSLEGLLYRMYAEDLSESRLMAEDIYNAASQVTPSFIKRVKRPDRGGQQIEYLRAIKKQLQEEAPNPERRYASNLVALLNYTSCPDRRVAETVFFRQTGELVTDPSSDLIELACGNRDHRRNRPGRAFERAYFTFKVVSDYGAFRDLQRHRMMTLEWPTLRPLHGYELPGELLEAANGEPAERFRQAIRSVEGAYRQIVEDLVKQGMTDPQAFEAAQYPLPFATRLPYLMEMNARQAMHLCELRSQPQGHPSYRRLAQQMHDHISDVAPTIAAAMKYVDHSDGEVGRSKEKVK